jgi:hypothetical protein
MTARRITASPEARSQNPENYPNPRESQESYFSGALVSLRGLTFLKL